jgi:hypothetical protein
MPIPLSCDCGRSMRIKDELAGRKIRCPACKNVITVRGPQATKAEDEVLIALPEDSESDIPVVQPVPKDASIRTEGQVRRPSSAVRRSLPVPLTMPAAPVKRRKLPRRKASRRSGPLLVVHREIVAGVLMMVGATVWFVVGFALGWVFFYPPILFVLGIAAVVRGLTGGSD